MKEAIVRATWEGKIAAKPCYLTVVLEVYSVEPIQLGLLVFSNLSVCLEYLLSRLL